MHTLQNVNTLAISKGPEGEGGGEDNTIVGAPRRAPILVSGLRPHRDATAPTDIETPPHRTQVHQSVAPRSGLPPQGRGGVWFIGRRPLRGANCTVELQPKVIYANVAYEI